MRLIRRRATGAQLLQGEHQLDRVEQACDASELCRRQAPREPHDLRSGHVDVDEEPRDREVGQGHRLRRDLEVEPVSDEEAVDHIELGGGAAVHAHDDPVLDHELRRRIVRAVRGNEPKLREGRHEELTSKLSCRTSGGAGGSLTHGRALSPHTSPLPRGRTLP